jgi:hypothetical protein
MLHKDPEERYQSYEELLTHLLYARQKLQKRSAERGGATAKQAVKAGSNKMVLGGLWFAAAALCLAVAAWFFVVRGPAPGIQQSRALAAIDAKTGPLLTEGRQALSALKFGDARAKFTAALAAAGEQQPLKNWTLAQLGLTALVAGETAQDTFEKLGNDAFFDVAPAPQAIGRFFQNLARGMRAPASVDPGYSASNFEAFGLLAGGVHDWNSGNLEKGGALIEQFANSTPRAPDEWVAELKPVATPYLADYRTYLELRDAAGKVAGGDTAGVLARIEQAKGSSKTGAPMVAQLEALAQKLRSQ